MCDDHTTPEDRGLGEASRGIDPDVDRAIERAIVPTSPPGPRMPGSGSGEVPSIGAAERDFRASIRARETTLSGLSTILRREAPNALANDPAVAAAQRRMTPLETEFRQIVSRSGTELTAPDRTRALALLDEAYEISDGTWRDGREAMWRSVYQSADGLAIIDAERSAGRIRLSSAAQTRGLALEFLYAPPGEASRWVTVDIDHMIPRERVSFYTFQPHNFHLQVDRFNRQWLNRFGAASPFPMGRYADLSSDELETFVQHHRLSRRGRPTTERAPGGRRRGRDVAVAALVGLLTLISARARAASYSEAVQAIREAQRRRRRDDREGHHPPVDGIDLWNLGSYIDPAFDVDICDIRPERISDLMAAARRWIEVEYVARSSSWAVDFERRLTAAEAAHDEDGLNRLLDEIGVDGVAAFGGMPGLGGHAGRIHTISQIERALVRHEMRRGDLETAIEHANDVQAATEMFAEEELTALALDVDDALVIVGEATRTANVVRVYLAAIEELPRLLRTAYDAEMARQARVLSALDAAAAANHPATGGTDSAR